MVALLKSRLGYLSVSFCLFLVSLPLVSAGATSGPRVLLWAGSAALCIAGLIPPFQRLLFAAKPDPGTKVDGENSR